MPSSAFPAAACQARGQRNAAMKRPSGQTQRPLAQPEPDPPAEPPPPPPAKLASRLLVSFQYLHVQLAGGAPWGFTLRGGLEHGEPLIVSKVEDGGKAALSQKMHSGDELVNINGTPLYGSRQEALILIKGSYRTLKMIIRRRNVPIIRPHSWHLAKLSEVRTEATTFPADPLSLSWHLGCETSDLPLPWSPLSHHCATEKSSSLGSMESLDPPSQSYYEGSLSPIDQAMYQSKRDSAYSSFSASSNTSDSALRPEESSSADSTQPGQLPEPHYLQTGGEPAGLPFLAPDARLPSGVQSGSLPSPAKAAAAPPQPPVRQDSLCACNSPLEAPRSLSHRDPLGPEGQWSSDTSLCAPGRDLHQPGGQLVTTGPLKDSLLTDQYYLLSSHTEQHPVMEKGPQRSPLPLAEENPRCPLEDPRKEKVHEAEPDSQESALSPWKAGWAGPFDHRHSIPEHLLVDQLQALDVSRGQEGPQWTVSLLQKEQKHLRASEPWLNPGRHSQDTCGQAEEPDPLAASGEESPSPPDSTCTGLERPQNALADPATSLPPPPQPCGDAGTTSPGLQAVPATDALPEAERSQRAARKGGPAQHRSAQTRRRSDRFATNLRNEIQWRKAQLQKAKGAGVLGCEEEPAQEATESPACASAPVPPVPSGQSKPHGFSGLPAVPPKRWGSELSVFCGKSALCSPQGPPEDLASKEKVTWPQKSVPLAGGGRRGRWRWSPEHKLQPQESEPGPSSQPPSEEPGLLPFADRRKFFEETSRLPSAGPLGSHQGKLNSAASSEAEKPGSAEHRDFRRHSLDQSYRCPALPPIYQDLRPQVPGLCKPPAPHSAERECWRPLPCSCAVREACTYCFRDECTLLHARNVPVPTSHCAHHCHPCPWSCYSDCCCPAQQKLLEDGGPWQARKPFQMEFPADEWELPASNRASSQSASQLLPCKMTFARVSPFWTCFESAEPARSPFCQAASTRDLSWDCERPRRTMEKVGLEAAHSQPHKPPSRERAYSESHPCIEPAGMPAREWREAPLAKLETGLKSPPCPARRKAPPPPRPPPPNWEKYRPPWTSHRQLLPAQAGLPAHLVDSWGPGQSSLEPARQRSQSLPMEQLWNSRSQLRLQHSPLPWAAPSGAPFPLEEDCPHYYCHGSLHRSLECLMPNASARSGSSRTARSLEEEATKESPRDEEQDRPFGSSSEQPPSLHPQPKDAAGGSPCPNQRAGPPPSRLDSEELRRDVAVRDRSLAGVLSSGLGLRSAAEVMGDLFAVSDGPPWKGQDRPSLTSGPGFPERQQGPPESLPSGGTSSPTSCLIYYNLSAGKAELLNEIKDRSEMAVASLEEEDLNYDLAEKKVQLIESIGQKLAVLQEAQQSLQDDLAANAALGRQLDCYIKAACKPHQFEKFHLVLGDLDKVVNLLLSLSGRLARAENALSGLDAQEEEEEKMALLEKKRQLMAQLVDAKELQEHVAQREQLLFASLSRCLPPEQLRDYQHFVRMKSALAIQQRQLDEKIKLGEEQLHCLWESLPQRPRDL